MKEQEDALRPYDEGESYTCSNIENIPNYEIEQYSLTRPEIHTAEQKIW